MSHVWPVDAGNMVAANSEAQSYYSGILYGGIEHLVGTEDIETVDMAGFAYNIWCQDDVNLPNCTSLSMAAFAVFGGHPLSGPQDQNIKTLTLSVPALISWNPSAAIQTTFSTIYFRDLQTLPAEAFLQVGSYLTDIYLAGSSVLAYPSGGELVQRSVTFHVPASLLTAYQTASGWSTAASVSFVSI